jgi:hypothetical protein
VTEPYGARTWTYIDQLEANIHYDWKFVAVRAPLGLEDAKITGSTLAEHVTIFPGFLKILNSCPRMGYCLESSIQSPLRRKERIQGFNHIETNRKGNHLLHTWENGGISIKKNCRAVFLMLG